MPKKKWLNPSNNLSFTMTSLQPYLIRAAYEWLVDNNMTPYLLVDATHPQAAVPQRYVNNGKIILNIRPQAVEALSLGNQEIQFNGRFNGEPMLVIVPVAAVLAIYAKEDYKKGMHFDPADFADADEPPPPPPPEQKPSGRPQLRVVK